MQNDANTIDRLASKPLEKPVKTLSEDHGHSLDDNALLGSLALRLREADWSKYERGSDAFLDVDRDLKELAKDSPLKAAELWAENAPKGLKPPEYITESLEQLQRPLEAGKAPQQPEAGDSGHEVPGSLKKRYLQADGKFHFREAQNKLAFEDRGAKMVTEHNDPVVASSMVELAEAKGWTKLKVAGHEDFKREVWLQASLKGIEVTGFKPKDVDLAKLEELRNYRMKNVIQAEVQAPGAQGKKDRGIPMESQPGKTIVYNDEPGMRGPEVVSADGTRTAFGGRDAIDRYASEHKLSPQDTKTLRDFDKRATEERTAAPAKGTKPELSGSYDPERNPEYFSGRLLAHGEAHFDFDKQNEKTYFVKVETVNGTKIHWGDNLKDVVGQSPSAGKLGERIDLLAKPEPKLSGDYKVAASVMADVLKSKGYSARVLDKALAEASKRLDVMQKGGVPAPAVKMFDKQAARERPREQLKPSRSKQKEAERNR